MFGWIGKHLARRILEILGFGPPSARIIEQYKHDKLTIMLFSHSSDADVLLQMLYMIAYPYIGNRCYTIVEPGVMNKHGWIRRRMGCISTKPGGTIDELVNRFKDESDVRLMISPKGHRRKAPWKSGYYHLAAGLKADLITVGIDYELKCVSFGPRRSIVDDNGAIVSREKIEPLLKSDMGQIVPLYPEYSPCHIREHDISNLYVMDEIQLLMICGLIGFVIVLILVTILIILAIIVVLVYLVVQGITGCSGT